MRYLLAAMPAPPRLPARRPEALTVHVRDLNLTPIKRYVDIQRERGKLVAIGQVDVDLEQMLERKFLCDRHRCIQWRRPHSKDESRAAIIVNACCSRYQVPV